MTNDTLTRVRAVVAGIADTATMARDFGAVFTVEGPAALALLSLAEAVVRDRQARVVVRGLLQSVSRGETEVAGVLAESLAVRGAAEDAIDAALAALADATGAGEVR